MPKLNTTVKSVRIDNEILEEFERKLGGQSINSWLNRRIEEYLGREPKENIREVVREVVKEVPVEDENLKEIGSMAALLGMSREDFLKGVCEGLTEGSLTVDKGKVVGVPEEWLEDYYEICHEVNRTPPEMMNKILMMIRRGQI